MAELEQILIAGGGIAGLTLAAALDQRGFTAELVERNQTWPAVGAGIAVQPNGIRMLHLLGMGAAVEEIGAIIHSWGFCDQEGKVLCETDLQALWGDAAPFAASSGQNFTKCWSQVLPPSGTGLAPRLYA